MKFMIGLILLIGFSSAQAAETCEDIERSQQCMLAAQYSEVGQGWAGCMLQYEQMDNGGKLTENGRSVIADAFLTPLALAGVWLSALRNTVVIPRALASIANSSSLAIDRPTMAAAIRGGFKSWPELSEVIYNYYRDGEAAATMPAVVKDFFAAASKGRVTLAKSSSIADVVGAEMAEEATKAGGNAMTTAAMTLKAANALPPRQSDAAAKCIEKLSASAPTNSAHPPMPDSDANSGS